MKYKVYKLKKNLKKYKAPANGFSKSFYNFQMYVNKSRVQRALKARKKFIKKYKRHNPLVLILKLLAFYYLLVGLRVLLGKMGL